MDNWLNFDYDVIVIGAGHAGCEASASAANLGSKVLLITMDLTKLGQMSCNPAIGGIAKGQIVREIDALGGYTGIVTDATSIQFRMLNRSKGPAMWSPRAQCDRSLFSLKWREILEGIPNLDFLQDMVVELLLKNDNVIGVKTRLGIEIKSRAVVLTTGTFMNGLIHVGRNQFSGGRDSESHSFGITEQLKELGFEVGRMKTGTPARLDGRSINWSCLAEQTGDENPVGFSFLTPEGYLPSQRSCYIAYTNSHAHDQLRYGFEDSPLYNGTIQGVGPRYCPSIEDKIVTFSARDRHQLFLEPEGWKTNEIYLNGFSSSLPWNVQLTAMQKVEGLEHVKIFRPGYAIEYDYFNPTQLKHSLETKRIGYLYFAGQINGTTGYEEAASQGLIAGINAHLQITGGSAFELRRDEAYIGVLIDDLVTKGVDEPYRMFTSRAEFRILLRQDNADVRLTPVGNRLGLVKGQRWTMFQQKAEAGRWLIDQIKKLTVEPVQINPILKANETPDISQRTRLINILLRPQIRIFDILLFIPDWKNIVPSFRQNEFLEGIETEIKYQGYIEREKNIAEKLRRLDRIEISEEFDFDKISSLSTESRHKLKRYKPRTIGEASRISGISPADLNVLLIHLGR
jgi:tRNA uridine 5-carboxymethylaminomethyl modification enzyme